MLLAIISALSVGVGVAQFVYVYIEYNTDTTNTDIKTFTWIAAGVWGSVFVSIHCT